METVKEKEKNRENMHPVLGRRSVTNDHVGNDDGEGGNDTIYFHAD